MNIDKLAEKIAEDSDNPRIIEVWVRKGILAGLRLAAEKCEEQMNEPECPERAEYCRDAILSLIPKEASNGGVR